MAVYAGQQNKYTILKNEKQNETYINVQIKKYKPHTQI